jgi:hypothetical protein
MVEQRLSFILILWLLILILFCIIFAVGYIGIECPIGGVILFLLAALAFLMLITVRVADDNHSMKVIDDCAIALGHNETSYTFETMNSLSEDETLKFYGRAIRKHGMIISGITENRDREKHRSTIRIEWSLDQPLKKN